MPKRYKVFLAVFSILLCSYSFVQMQVCIAYLGDVGESIPPSHIKFFEGDSHGSVSDRKPAREVRGKGEQYALEYFFEGE